VEGEIKQRKLLWHSCI